MDKIFGSPQRYIQGPGVVERLGDLVGYLGDRFFIFADEIVLPLVRGKIIAGMERAKKEAAFEHFLGESCREEIVRLSEKLKDAQGDVVVGVGGGKAADTAKAIGMTQGKPVVVIPTIASTDAPTSRIVAIYDQNHRLVDVWRMEKNPDAVVADTAIIVQAPVRFLVAGMGDALSTKFEAEACASTHAANFFKGESCQTALILAQTCYNIIRQLGIAAKRSVEERRVTDAVEKVVEANIYMSGVGFESGGLAAAHAVHAGLTMIPELNRSFHGEKVAFGLLVQFVMEGRDRVFLEEMISFLRELGLPTTLGELGLPVVTDEALHQIAERACLPNTYMHNMPMHVDEAIVVKSILEADALGRAPGQAH